MILSGIILVASRFFYVSHEMRGCMSQLPPQAFVHKYIGHSTTLATDPDHASRISCADD